MYCHNTSNSSITIMMVPANSSARGPVGRCNEASVSNIALAGVTVSPLLTIGLPRSTVIIATGIASAVCLLRFSVSASLYSRFGTMNEPSISPSKRRSLTLYSAGQISFSDFSDALAVSLSRIEISKNYLLASFYITLENPARSESPKLTAAADNRTHHYRFNVFGHQTLEFRAEAMFFQQTDLIGIQWDPNL